MSNLVCLQVVFFSLLLGLKFCYSFIGVRRTIDIITRKIEFSMKKTSEWDDDSIQSVGMSEASLPTLDPALIAKLGDDLNTLVSTSAINTVSYYMLEFRDDVFEGWMKSFANYSVNGFPNGRWEDYVESMIKQDMQSFQVTMRPPKALLRGRNSKMGGNVVLVYDVELEPRKIAHQILTVREHVCEELISDLYCVRSEHDEAIRYATVKMKDGKEIADKSRRKPRDPSDVSTPNRSRNYFNLEVLLTGMALESLKSDLEKKKDKVALNVLENVIEDIQRKHVVKNVAEKFFSELFGPRTLLEDLYFLGITNGVQVIDGKNVNVLKLAQNLFELRLSYSLEAQKMLRYQNLNNRQYYKMIKDFGGFKKLDLKQAKMRILDLDAEKREQDEAAAAAALVVVANTANDIAVDAAASEPAVEAAAAQDATAVLPSPVVVVGESVEKDSDEGNLFGTDFGTAGPVVMM